MVSSTQTSGGGGGAVRKKEESCQLPVTHSRTPRQDVNPTHKGLVHSAFRVLVKIVLAAAGPCFPCLIYSFCGSHWFLNDPWFPSDSSSTFWACSYNPVPDRNPKGGKVCFTRGSEVQSIVAGECAGIATSCHTDSRVEQDISTEDTTLVTCSSSQLGLSAVPSFSSPQIWNLSPD